MVRRFGLLSVVLLTAALGAPPGEPGVPAWLRDINPAEYVLLQANLPPGWEVVGDIGAEATAQMGEWRDAQGGRHGLRRMGLIATEMIAQRLDNELKNHTNLTIGVFESPAMAIQAIREFGWEGGDPADSNKLSDARLPGRGGGNWGGTVGMLRYRHMILYLLVSGDGETVIPQVMKWWLDKVAGKRMDKWPDLVVPPDALQLVFAPNHPKQLREPAADQQMVLLTIRNTMPGVKAEGVKLQLYWTPAGATEKTAFGAPVDIGTIEPEKLVAHSQLIDLGGQNVEGATLTAEAYIPAWDDFKPEDNLAAIKFSLWYAHNGTRAYSLDQDGYSFDNYGVDGREAEEWAESLVATAVNLMQGSNEDKVIWERLLVPQTYTQLSSYVKNSQQAGVGGHCYGMCATSALYFLSPGNSPNGVLAGAMSLGDASTNIGILHRAQMRSVVDAMMTGWDWQRRQFNAQQTYDAIKAQLSGPREPAVIEFFGQLNGQPAGHAVLAYKLIHIDGRHPTVLVYDPNFPPSECQPPRAMPQITLRIGESNWSNPEYMGYAWASAHQISAKPVVREMPVEALNAWLPGMRKQLEEMLAKLRAVNGWLAMVRCPADVVFTDAQGRRTGTRGEESFAEIPGSAVLAAGEVDLIQLPRGPDLRLEVSSTGGGDIAVEKLEPNDQGGVNLASFAVRAGGAGERIAGTMGTTGGVNLTHGGQALRPAIHAHLGAEDLQRGTVGAAPPTTPAPPVTPPPTNPTPPVTPPTTPAAPDTGALTICRAVTDGTPVNPGTTFDHVAEIWCYWEFDELAEGTEVTCVWKRNGKEFSRRARTIGGSGAVWFGIMTQGGDLPEGNWEVGLESGGRVLARKAFTITAG